MGRDPEYARGNSGNYRAISREFQLLMANDGLYTQIIDFLPYPIAIFTPHYTLAMVNKAFASEIIMRFKDLEKGALRILQYKTDDALLAAAVKQVFAGETSFLQELKNPFSIFSGITLQDPLQSERFNRAIVFPVTTDDNIVTHGVIMFMPCTK